MTDCCVIGQNLDRVFCQDSNDRCTIRNGRAQWSDATFNEAKNQTSTEDSTACTLTAVHMQWPVDGICIGYLHKCLRKYGISEDGPTIRPQSLQSQRLHAVTLTFNHSIDRESD